MRRIAVKSKYSIGIGLIVLVVVALMLWPRGTDLERLNNMYERGQYEAVYTQLGKALEKKPDWHEARELLVKAAIKGDRPDLALAHMTDLVRAGEGTAHLEVQFDSWLSQFATWEREQLYPWLEEQIGLLPEEERDLWLEQYNFFLEERYDSLDQEFSLWLQEQFITWMKDYQNQEVPKALLAAAAEGYALGHWEWIREVYLELLSRFGCAEEIPLVVEEIFAVQTNIKNISLAWSAVEQAGDYQALWELSTFLDNRGQGRNQYRQDVLYIHRSKPHVLGQLAVKFPGDALLAAAKAQEMEPEEGLDFLRQWEEKHEVEAAAREYYSTAKASLLVDVELPAEKDFHNITSSRLIQVAAEWLDHPKKCNLVLDYLAQDFPHEVGILRAGLKVPKSCDFLEGHSPSLSPDETMLGYYSSGPVLYELATQNKKELDIEAYGPVKWMWKPDSSGVAVNSSWHHQVEIFDRSGKRQGEELVFDGGLEVLGWDNGDLLVSGSTHLERPLLLFNPDTGEFKPADPAMPSDPWAILFLGSHGNWASQESGRSITMLLDKEVYRLESMTMGIVSWLPDGSGLLLSQASEEKRFYLWTGGEPEKLGVQGRFLGWKNEDEFYWARDFGRETQDLDRFYFWEIKDSLIWGPGDTRPELAQLMGYNIRTHDERDYKLAGNWQCAVGNTAISAGLKIRIYHLN